MGNAHSVGAVSAFYYATGVSDGEQQWGVEHYDTFVITVLHLEVETNILVLYQSHVVVVLLSTE